MPWLLCGVLSVIIIALCVKIYILKRSVTDICAELSEHLNTDTNTLLSVSSNDKHIRYLAAELNRQLQLLREQRRKYLNGDRELKEAITNISHDLRTPLTAVCGYLELLEQEEKSENAARYLSLIENRTEALKHLTEELFRYSVIVATDSELYLENLDVNRVLEESIASFYVAFTERGITPTIHLSEKKLMRNLDWSALSRVFGNVLNNALKYSDGDLDITLLHSGEIIFTNSAEALNEVQVGKLFDRFFTVETARNSTGLGLAISKTLVERMGGEIRALYRDGKLSIYLMFP